MTSKSFTRQWLEACGGCCRCSLSTQRQQVVVSRGDPNAQVMLIGEAPGASEDAQGLPFVGRSGQLLDQLLVQAGLSPDRDLFITNVVKCRPPDNRKPSAKELSACRPWIDEQIATLTEPNEQPLRYVTAAATVSDGFAGARVDSSDPLALFAHDAEIKA